MMSKLTRAAALLLLLPFPALAQDAGDDWDLRRERDLTVADAIFDSGLGVGVRCQDGGFGVVIVGLETRISPTASENPIVTGVASPTLQAL